MHDATPSTSSTAHQPAGQHCPGLKVLQPRHPAPHSPRKPPCHPPRPGDPPRDQIDPQLPPSPGSHRPPRQSLLPLQRPAQAANRPARGKAKLVTFPRGAKLFSCFILCIFLPPPPRPTFRSFWLFFPLCLLPVLPLAPPSASRPHGQPRSWLLLQPGRPHSHRPSSLSPAAVMPAPSTTPNLHSLSFSKRVHLLVVF